MNEGLKKIVAIKILIMLMEVQKNYKFKMNT